MQEENDNPSGFGGLINFNQESKVFDPQNAWDGKGSDNMWGLGKNENAWRGTNSNEMIDEGDPV